MAATINRNILVAQISTVAIMDKSNNKVEIELSQ